MMKRYNCIFMALVALALFACQGRKTASGDGDGGDTLKMKYARLLTIVRHGEGTYDEVMIANPWKAGACCIAISSCRRARRGMRPWRSLPGAGHRA